ncbi:BREX-2 system adenine-specific DNA-methyltransferase PglX [Frankia sp. Cr2]|uniref:BREX-2 system adenine-specific DNA-methyltransferase PglX n=1 Tax=Frankia sp. Cr2 TaxID=3073932 RepID=UPI002AD4B5E1|nr:BREX-2 system adenine-specific DNA-methyltransferase PglX [Frankia sp. Cr2]
MIDRGSLLKDLQRQIRTLEADLREQVVVVEEVGTALRAEYLDAFRVKRTAATWASWRDERVTQAAVAWVLATVFVRFCEDNGLLAEPYLAGPDTSSMTLAEESQDEFFRTHPAQTDRDWLLAAFDAIAGVPVGASLFDRRHNALYQIPVSHDAAKGLIAFWRRRGEDARLVHDFTDPAWDTRFLGDLYQDLSEDARKRYALLQTPEFVEEFILDLTLSPAIDEFGYDVVKMIDPTCGSGHFLLGAFHRLLAEWENNAPGRDAHERVRLALDAVHGVDVNPFAVAIARFRLLVAALRAAGFSSLAEAAGYTFPLHIAVGDSLIKHRQLGLFDSEQDEFAAFSYATEDVTDHPGILAQGRYHAVVGNPPYITVKDKELNQHYRELYDACSGKYALSAPFAQRFFELAREADADGRGAGYVGQITANSFMKREFGKKLIEQFFANKVELTHIIDTSGAYIPGHGTPTVILAGRRKDRKRAETVRAVLGIRGEPSAPAVPSEGLVWRAIVEQIDHAGSESEWVSVVDLPRERVATYPWSLSGGGASDLQAKIEVHADIRLGQIASSIGITSFTLEDDLYLLPESSARRHQIENAWWRPMIVGDSLRDWAWSQNEVAVFPYDRGYSPIDVPSNPPMHRYLWPGRTNLCRSILFGGRTKVESGLKWSEYGRLTASKLRVPLSIALAFVGTHNHFVLDRGGKVFNRTAPVIKLPESAGEDEHLRLLGVLNSSTACFWLKQVSHNKGNEGYQSGIKTEMWERFYEFTGTKLQEFPLPAEYPLELARELDGLAQRLGAVSPSAVAADEAPTRARLAQARREWESTRTRMIALQEELDWQVYSLYGLLPDELTAPGEAVPELTLGERAFEIVLARRMAAGEASTAWFTRHGSTPITELPGHWPAEYRAVVERRIAVIGNNRHLALIERPECKRRWATEGWDSLQAKALRDWLLDRCEARELWFHEVDAMVQPRPLTTSQLADELRRDQTFVAVAELYQPGGELTGIVADLVADEHVPFLAALRYTDDGLVKRGDWEHVWDLQRAEDAAPTEEERLKIRDRIPVPPKYKPTDFRRTSFWRQRGKLDVPKERFVSYPHACRDGDSSLLVGWAGWDHREQAQALATLVVEREQNDGWGAERLAPLLAGLREVLAWVWQWHGEFDPLYDGSPAEVYEGFLADCTNRLHLREDGLADWRPPVAPRGRRKKT